MKHYLRKILAFGVDLFLYVFPRDPKIILCTGWGGERFADNSRYIFLYLNEHKQEYGISTIIWLTVDDLILKELKGKGYKVLKKNSLLSIYYHLRAKYCFYDQFVYDYYRTLIRGAKVINLWHGMPIKKFGVWNGLNWNLEDNYLLTCSAYGDSTIGKAFITEKEHYIHGMYPRNYYILNEMPLLLKVEQGYLEKVAKVKKTGKRILFYLPTFRKDKLSFLGESSQNKLNSFFKFLNDHNYCLLTKFHYAGFVRNHDEVCSKSSVLINLPPSVDVYPFLKEADILLTDYSSVLFDYLYLDRRIICFPYDLEEYQMFDQGLLIDYYTLPVSIVKDIQHLQSSLISEDEKEQELMRENRHVWLEKCFNNYTIKDTINNIFDERQN